MKDPASPFRLRRASRGQRSDVRRQRTEDRRLKSEPQNRRILNRRISKGGIATLFLFLAKIDRIPYFGIRRSIFIIRFFIFLNPACPP